MVDTAVMEQASDKASSSSQDTAASSGAGFDLVAASDWPDLPAEVVLLSPAQCRTLWRQFSSDSIYAVRQVSMKAHPGYGQTAQPEGRLITVTSPTYFFECQMKGVCCFPGWSCIHNPAAAAAIHRDHQG